MWFVALCIFARLSWRARETLVKQPPWLLQLKSQSLHYNDVIMSTMASQITSLMIVYSTFHSGTDQRKHQSSTLLAFVQGIHQWLVNSPHKRPVTWKIFPFDDVIMKWVVETWLWYNYQESSLSNISNISDKEFIFVDFISWCIFSLRSKKIMTPSSNNC